MSGSIYMAAEGALAYEQRLEIISNNLANINTSGFKKDKALFQAFLNSETMGTDPARMQAAAESQAASLWVEFSSQTDFSEGQLRPTGNAFDLALVGNGFFCIQAPAGVQYTRRGDFSLNSDGVLVSKQGWPVLGKGGEIKVADAATSGDGQTFSVDNAGNVYVGGSQIDSLRVVDFAQPRNLEKVDNTMFRSLDGAASETAAEDFKVSQGFLELSNVSAVNMMTEMVETLRGYETYQKMIRIIDEVNASTINEVGSPA